jgi:ABC-type lipoprotein release transport system permease subunit
MRALTSAILVAAFLGSSGLGAQGDVVAHRAPGILISRQLAEARHLRVGATVRLSSTPSDAAATTFVVDGIYEPAPDPLRFAQQRLEARLHLPDLIALHRDGSAPEALQSIGAINVALVNPADARAFADDVASRVPGLVAQPVNAPDARTGTFVVIERFHLAIAVVSITGSAVFLLALMVMLIDERRETVGVLRLIGFSRRRILLQVVIEGALVAATGTVVGVLFAFASQNVFNRFFQWRYDTSLVFLRVTPSVVLESALFALPLGILASLFASWTFVRKRLLALVRR